jgi:hypothetical protein
VKLTWEKIILYFIYVFVNMERWNAWVVNINLVQFKSSDQTNVSPNVFPWTMRPWICFPWMMCPHTIYPLLGARACLSVEIGSIMTVEAGDRHS